jgi:hypothetical protein
MTARSNDSTTRGSKDRELEGKDNSIGNQQGTTQTGGQNGGGENREQQQEDEFTEDLRRSGNRKSREE